MGTFAGTRKHSHNRRFATRSHDQEPDEKTIGITNEQSELVLVVANSLGLSKPPASYNLTVIAS